MFIRIILLYFLGIVIEVNFHTDTYFLFFILSVIMVLLTVEMFYKRHIKDIKTAMSFMILLAIFSLTFVGAILYTKYEMNKVSFTDSYNSVYEIEGKIVQVKHKNQGQEITIRVEKIVDLANDRTYSKHPGLIMVTVSSLHEYQLFELVNLIGEIKYKNFKSYYEDEPLFFMYELEQLFYTTPYSVPYVKKIQIKSTEKNMYETVLANFYNTSEQIKNRINDYMQEPFAGIAQGISLGQQENISKDIKDIFRTSGLIHILVLSGANVAFIISLIWYILSKSKNKYRVWIANIFAWVFIFGTGLTPPSVRAGVMASTNIFAEYFGKNISPLHSLLVSLFFLTLLNPLILIFSPSLHLSFLACFGLFVVSPKLKNYCGKNKYFKNLVAIFLGIFITITPYILALSGTSNLFGTILTFIVEPFVLLTTIFSFIIIVTSFVSFDFLPLAQIFGILNTLVVKLILLIATFGAENLPTISIVIPKYLLLIYYTLLIIFFAKKWKINAHDIIGKSNE